MKERYRGGEGGIVQEKQENTLLKHVIETFGCPYYILDVKDYKIKIANSLACSSILPQNITCHALTHKTNTPCRGKEHPCPIEEVKRTKKPVIVEHIHYDENGNMKNIEVHGYPICDSRGNVVHMIEYHLDVTERKKIERLQEKRFEVRIKTSEKDRIPLTKKEKLVLYGLCAYPRFNDKMLAEKLNLKRPTVTAIRNRLKKENWFKIINIPNFYALGCELFSIVHCNFNTALKERKELGIIDEIKNFPEVVFSSETDECSLGIFVSKKFIDIRKFLDSSSIIKHEILKNEINLLNFFYELSMIKALNFSSLLNYIFEFGFPERKEQTFHFEKISLNKLNHNNKRILYTLVQFPEASIAEIAKKVWLSRLTVSKIKKKLIKEGFLITSMIPNLRKLSLELFAAVSFKFEPKIMKKVYMLDYKIRKKECNTVMKIIGNKDVTSLMFFKNKEECEERVNQLVDFYNKNNIPFEKELVTFPLEKLAFMKLDLATLTKNLLFPEDF
jgi:DNA-binding MarR family transcriptional regulator